VSLGRCELPQRGQWPHDAALRYILSPVLAVDVSGGERFANCGELVVLYGRLGGAGTFSWSFAWLEVE
jgi:hypothetical protein